MADGLIADTVSIDGHGGDAIPAYRARPQGAGPAGAVVVIHHMPGWDWSSKEIVRRFADGGYLALMPNLHHREAPGASPEDASAAVRAAGGVPDERLVGDVAAAREALLALPECNGKVAVIGYCSGGRQSFLAACSLEFDAAVDCYGAFVAAAPPPESPVQVRPVLEQAAHLSCPLLGLFGAEDSHPSPDEVRQIDEELTRLGKDHEFHVIDGAGHAFFAVDRPNYRVEAAREGWRLIWDWFGRHLT